MLEIIFRTVFFYFFIVLAFRIMGKREVGQLGIVDLIVSIMIAEISAFSIEKIDDTIFLGIVPIVVLVLLELALGFMSLKCRMVEKVLEGKPTMLINDGKIIYKNLVNQRYSIDDLLLELRKKEISSIEEVEYAFLETNGELSIFKYKPLKIKGSLPLPVVIEGVIQYDVLESINKTENWLLENLENNSLSLDMVFYALYKKSHLYIIKRN